LTTPRQKFAAHAFLALTLLIAQWIAQAHAFSHFRPASDSANAPATQSQLCAECLAGAPLFAAASAPNIAFWFQTACPEKIDAIRVVSLIERAPLHAFRSRAPPHLV
jgi:hypothetical protein